MLFLISLASSILFFLIFYKAIRRKPVLFYLLTTFSVVYLFGSYLMDAYQWWPEWFMDYVVLQYSRGSLSTAVFAIVMYLGVLSSKRPGVNHLKSIRGEISIIGSILALGHNIYYGIYYFINLFTLSGELTPPYIVATWISIILILIMLPLMITSFRSVRKRMKASSWKRLQQLAYPFYVLLYAHVMIVLIANIRGTSTILSILTYSAIFLPYFVLRALKFRKDAQLKKVRTSYGQKSSSSAA